MPFLMTHLYVAQNLYNLQRHTTIKHLPQFYLGVAAPDAVHNRRNYISEYKKASHLCVGEERWGMITNNDEWLNSVLSFLDRHKDVDDLDFLMGYCTHILTDIYNNIAVWTPFRETHQGERQKQYHQESEKVDVALALKPQNEEDFWVHMRSAKACDFFGLVFSGELEMQKNHILCDWYAGKAPVDTSRNRVVSVESTRKFIDGATEFVAGKLELSHLPTRSHKSALHTAALGELK